VAAAVDSAHGDFDERLKETILADCHPFSYLFDLHAAFSRLLPALFNLLFNHVQAFKTRKRPKFKTVSRMSTN
jgi:hypothetical protein